MGPVFLDKIMRNQNDRAVKPTFVLFALCVSAAPALAQEPAGCDKFKWPLDKERARQRPAETGFGQPGAVAAAVRDDGNAKAV